MIYTDLLPTHNTLRSPSSIAYFSDSFKAGKIPKRDRPASIIETEDGNLYIHDGHHFIHSAYKCGVNIGQLGLNHIKYSYRQMQEINFVAGWCTPYNPKTHCRRHILAWYKPYILGLASVDTVLAIQAIRMNFDIYAHERKISKLEELSY